MDVRPRKPDNDAPTVDLDDYVGKIQHGSTVYVISSSLLDFVDRVWPTIPVNVSFVLVTGAAVTSVPFDNKKGAKGGRALSWAQSEFKQFIEDPRIIHWFTQNCVTKHPKLTAIPIGLDYRWLNRANNPRIHTASAQLWARHRPASRKPKNLTTGGKVSHGNLKKTELNTSLQAENVFFGRSAGETLLTMH
jgi:hypothetical protein